MLEMPNATTHEPSLEPAEVGDDLTRGAKQR
jgi:hypothetical protein